MAIHGKELDFTKYILLLRQVLDWVFYMKEICKNANVPLVFMYLIFVSLYFYVPPIFHKYDFILFILTLF